MNPCVFLYIELFKKKWYKVCKRKQASGKGSDFKLEKKREKSFNLSYESDGKMGKNKKETNLKKKDAEIFFNNTQNSE